MKQLFIIVVCAINSYFVFAEGSTGKEIPFTLDDRDRIIRLEEKVESLQNEMNAFRNEMNERINSLRNEMNAKFESIDLRFESIDARLDSMFTFLWILTGIFTVIMVTAITLVFWDRKTLVEVATKKAVEKIEKESRLIAVLKELAKEDKKIAGVLRQFELL